MRDGIAAVRNHREEPAIPEGACLTRRGPAPNSIAARCLPPSYRRHLHRRHRRLQRLRAQRAGVVLPPGGAALAGLPAGRRGRRQRLPDRRRRPCRRRWPPCSAASAWRHGVHRRQARRPARAAWLPRPIDPMHVLRELDALVELRLALPDPPSEMMPLGRSRDGSTTCRAPRLRAERPPPRAGAGAAPARRRAGAAAAAARCWWSRTARSRASSCKRRLQRPGLPRADCASRRGGAGPARRRRSFAIVFLDVALGPPGSIDGLQLCQRIKQRGAHAGGAAHRGGDGHRRWTARPTACAARSPAATPT